jgi:hypothetical protein
MFSRVKEAKKYIKDALASENMRPDYLNRHQLALCSFLLLKVIIYDDEDAFILLLKIPSGKGKSRIVFVLGRSIQ